MSKTITNHEQVIKSIFVVGLLILIGGCSTQKVKNTPSPNKYTYIEEISFDNGFPNQRQPWVIYSDRSNNKVNSTSKEDPNEIYKQASFLDPFVVLDIKRGMFKVARYKPDLINDGKLPKSKKLKIEGWIPEENLLLWNNSLKNSKSGFSYKAAIVVNNQDVITHSEKYIEGDSVILFSNPSLISKTGKKISFGSIVYLYKQSEDKNQYLIGKHQNSIPDSIQNNIYGWVNKNVLSLWGERYSVKSDSMELKFEVKNSKGEINHYTISTKEQLQRNFIENLYPVNSSKNTKDQAKFFTNIFNYNKNKIYNVLGDPIFYEKYKETLADNKKMNIIFVLDMSKNNRLYIPVTKSLLQELQLNLSNPNYFSSIKFGGVVYKQNTCGISVLNSSLSSNYTDVALFFEEKIEQLTCNDNNIVQPVDKGLWTASRMLSGKENETNIVILIGTTANQTAQTQSAINALTRINARTIFFQTQSKSADSYNDFVLLGEKAVVNSSKNIAERKKEKIVNQNDLLLNNNYSLSTGESGIYYLDFPTQSMTQGFVIFPKKGEAMQAGVLKTAIDSLLVQVTKDNQKIDSTLTKYFRSDIGVNNTRLPEMFGDLFPLKSELIPNQVASSLLGQNGSFLINSTFAVPKDSLNKIVKHGILLNETEYDQLRNFYKNVYKKVVRKGKFNKKQGINYYLDYVSENTYGKRKLKRGELKKMPMAEITKMTTGFTVTENKLMDLMANTWMKNKKIKSKDVYEYFVQFRDLAAKLATSKGDPAIRIDHKGQTFYWLSDEYVPLLKRVSK